MPCVHRLSHLKPLLSKYAAMRCWWECNVFIFITGKEGMTIMSSVVDLVTPFLLGTKLRLIWIKVSRLSTQYRNVTVCLCLYLFFTPLPSMAKDSCTGHRGRNVETQHRSMETASSLFMVAYLSKRKEQEKEENSFTLRWKYFLTICLCI